MIFLKFGKFIQGTLKGELASDFIRTFLTRGLTAFGAMILIIIVGRLYGPSGVGVLALAQSILLGAGILARNGMDNALMRFVGRDPQYVHVKVYLRWAFTKAFLLSLLTAVFIFLASDLLEYVFKAEGLGIVLVFIATAVPAFTLGFLFSGFFKGARKPATACLMENGSVALVASVLIYVLHWLMPDAGLIIIGMAYSIAAWLVLLKGSFQIWYWLKGSCQNENEKKVNLPELRKEFFTSSNAFFILSMATFMQSVVAIMIAGWLLDSEELGLFKSSQQVASLISFVLIVINAIFPPRFARLYHEGNLHELEVIARKGSLWGMLIAAPISFICIVFPHWVLGLVGDEFTKGAYYLQILAIGHFINVATGPVGYILNMTGHEKLMRNIALIINLIGLLLLLLFIPMLGALGASIVLAIALIVQNLLAIYFVRLKLGIWILPSPYLSKPMEKI